MWGSLILNVICCFTCFPKSPRLMDMCNPVRGRAEHSLKLKGVGPKKEGGASVPVLAGAAPGGKTVDFRPTFGPPSLLEAEIPKTKKGPRHISPISPTKQEPTGGEVIFSRTRPPLSRISAGRRTPTPRYAFAFAYAMFSGPHPGGAPPWDTSLAD